jgi:peptide/nickel transport system substrate-binding protein
MFLLAVLLAAGCAPGVPSRSEVPAVERPEARPFKRLVAVLASEPDLGPSPPTRGAPPFRLLVRAGLTIADNQGARRPQLAEAVPTVENGLWKVLPDGQMETTWRLKRTAQWHDGTPLTGADLLFTATVLREGQIPEFRTDAYGWIDRVEAPAPDTVTVGWSRPYIDADTLFTHELTPPFPKHLLETPYREDPADFTKLPYWRGEYVGAGPYRVREWVPGSHIVVAANDAYVLGRPRIDEIEVRFIEDANARLATVLAGAAEMTLGVGLSVDQAMQAATQWRDGTVAIEFIGNWVAMFPQLLDPTPAAISDVRFRKAMMHALNRHEMVETLQGGLVPVAHSYLVPNQPRYRDIEARLDRYDYEPRRAVQLLEDMSFVRGGDDAMRDATNQPVAVSIRSPAGSDIATKSALATADYWQRLGLAVATETIPPQRMADLAYVATFPGFFVTNPGHDLRSLADLHSSRARIPANNFRVPGIGNYSRYMSPQLDGLLDRYFATIPERDRLDVLGEIIAHVADRLNVMGLFYNGTPEMIGRRLTNVTTGRPPIPSAQITWNVHEWDLK